MAVGLRCWDSAGLMTVNITSRLSRLHGSVITGTSSGSISVPKFSQGTPYHIAAMDPSYSGGLWGAGKPYITISGTTLSWDFSSVDPAVRASTQIFYGTY